MGIFKRKVVVDLEKEAAEEKMVQEQLAVDKINDKIRLARIKKMGAEQNRPADWPCWKEMEVLEKKLAE